MFGGEGREAMLLLYLRTDSGMLVDKTSNYGLPAIDTTLFKVRNKALLSLSIKNYRSPYVEMYGPTDYRTYWPLLSFHTH